MPKKAGYYDNCLIFFMTARGSCWVITPFFVNAPLQSRSLYTGALLVDWITAGLSLWVGYFGLLV
jgi:hypothetical protein